MLCLRWCVLAASVLVFTPAYAATPEVKTVAALHQERIKLSGQTVQVRGKIVKVNDNIMQRNWLHLQDGTGAEGSNDLTITSDASAKLGDEVVVTGTVTVDKDFGAGYAFPLLLEKAKITPAKK